MKGFGLLLTLTIVISCVFLPSSCIPESQVEDVGILGKINPSGLELLNDIIVQVLSAQVPKVSIPEMTGSAIWMYQLTNFRIEVFRIPSASLSTSSPNIVTAEIEGASFSIIGQFKLTRKTLFLRRTKETVGSFRGSASGVDLSVGIAIDKDQDGKPMLTLESCTADIGKLKLRAFGDSFAVGVVQVLDAASFVLRNFLEGLICPQINLSVNERLDEILAKFNPILPLPLNTSIDISLVRSPVMVSNSAELAFSGRCFPTDFPNLRFNITQSSLTSVEDDSARMFQVVVSEYVINTFLASVLRHKLFRQSITQAELNDAINFDVSARVLSYVIHSLIPYIGKPLRFSANPSRTPVASFLDDFIDVSLGYKFLIQVDLGNGSYFDALRINLAINITGSVEADDNVISGRFDAINVTVLESGSLPSAFLESIISGVVDREVIPRLNNLTTTGLKIPSFYGFQMRNAQLKIKENSFEISGDVMRA